MSRKVTGNMKIPMAIKHAIIIEQENGFFMGFYRPTDDPMASEVTELVAITVEDMIVEVNNFWPKEI